MSRPAPHVRLRGIVLRIALAAWTLGLTGCVTVYQPLSGLHGPVVVDPGLENFPELDLVIRCIPRELLEPEDAERLCQKLERLFENQGARVTTIATLDPDDRDDADADAEGGDDADTGPRPHQLTLELRARELDAHSSGIMWFWSIMSFTLAPAMSEQTFEQQVTVRDATGARLMTASLEGRLVRYYGLGYWVGNGLLNWLFRDDDEDLDAEQLERSLSDDLYRQLSQIVYNAEQRHRVLSPTGPGAPDAAAPSVAPVGTASTAAGAP